jgi:hypothetical protein
MEPLHAIVKRLLVLGGAGHFGIIGSVGPTGCRLLNMETMGAVNQMPPVGYRKDPLLHHVCSVAPLLLALLAF